jgi:amidase
LSIQDAIGALVPHGRVERAGAAHGPLAGATLVVKDIFDVEGTVTGRGNADWLASSAPAAKNAPAVQVLLDAGARLVGKAVTEELAFGVIGINAHYGMPKNVSAPGRVPGGSSSGSAAAVGASLVDLALGSDTGGSVRVPASYNGILGMRPSHGRISLDGIMPLAPSFDTVGWFARDPALFVAAGRVLLHAPVDSALARPTGRLLLARDAFERVEPDALAALRGAVAQVERVLGPAQPVVVSGEGLDVWYDVFRTLQGAEAWAAHGAWIEQARPKLGPQCARRFAFASTIDAASVARAGEARAAIVGRLDALLADGALLVVPSAAGVAPRADASATEHEAMRDRVIGITSIASLGGLPQVSLPLGRLPEGPVGLSLVAGRGGDGLLLDLVAGALGGLRQPAAG